MTDERPEREEESSDQSVESRDLPIVQGATPDAAPASDSTGDSPTVVGVLLAAGTSSRFGDENKLLATVDSEPIVRRAAQTLLESGVDSVVVVLGYEAERVRDALDGLSVEFVVNDDYETGQASSLRRGIEAVRENSTDADAVVVALGDMPFVSPETVDTLCAAYAADAGDALAAAFDGNRGNPVLFDSRHFDALLDTEGDIGGREILLDGEASALVAVDDPGIRRDVDVPDDI
ncbi:NTP transferase domain-containing protein [Haloferax namakaokahaiae]|uniref:NTP transferase domain-containing protein n=1 Tax=Haloferax namakaokahaiae TaxID=1748331 RepID=A0ABD5ZIM6_9EURY